MKRFVYIFALGLLLVMSEGVLGDIAKFHKGDKLYLDLSLSPTLHEPLGYAVSAQFVNSVWSDEIPMTPVAGANHLWEVTIPDNTSTSYFDWNYVNFYKYENSSDQASKIFKTDILITAPRDDGNLNLFVPCPGYPPPPSGLLEMLLSFAHRSAHSLRWKCTH